MLQSFSRSAIAVSSALASSVRPLPMIQFICHIIRQRKHKLTRAVSRKATFAKLFRPLAHQLHIQLHSQDLRRNYQMSRKLEVSFEEWLTELSVKIGLDTTAMAKLLYKYLTSPI